ncbi:unnamed protein product [Effrenium voratum]|nr:unnamed protein product [Effrenium voratum]
MPAIKEIAASGDSDQVPPELAWWGDKKENEDPGSVEASTCESFWEEFPNDAQVLLEVELRDSMPVTEVKLLVPQTASFLHEYFVEDWEGFRNWLEPEDPGRTSSPTRPSGFLTGLRMSGSS